MKPVELIYAKNSICRRQDLFEQELTFLVSVDNLSYDKLVTVHWCPDNGQWQSMQACYHSRSGANRELWQAHAIFAGAAAGQLPGTIRFALRYCAAGTEYWDNNCSKNYTAAADCGIMAPEGVGLLNIDFSDRFEPGQEFYPVTAAVHESAEPRQVFIRWTPDSWRSCCTADCFFKRRHWDRNWPSTLPNPNAYGWSIWISHIPVQDVFRLEYAVGCDTGAGTIWDNNLGLNYPVCRPRLTILTLNLHCYQEQQQDEKLSRIAAAIDDLGVDIVCLQEVGENWNHGQGDWPSNAAKIINDRLHCPYHLFTDWSHIGFGCYREGSAILSRYPFVRQESGYVSAMQDVHSIHARKVCLVQVAVPYMGLVNVFCVHLSWWSDGFRQQFENLRQWADRVHAGSGCATFLCGDFNVPAGSRGYRLATAQYTDQFVSARDWHKGRPQQAAESSEQDGRIDFIFLKKGSRLQAAGARAVFTEHDFGKVSDHEGYCMEFEPV